MKTLLSSLAFALCLYATPCFAATDPTAEIAYLIDLVRHSDCTFIRNGSEYDGAKAADHVQQKYDYYRKEIFTAEDFIDKAATKSMLSGAPYQVRCPGEAATPAATWLRTQLQLYRTHPPSGTGGTRTGAN